MYRHVSVTGPSEFAELPAEDQAFWNHWLIERLEQSSDESNQPDGISMDDPPAEVESILRQIS